MAYLERPSTGKIVVDLYDDLLGYSPDGTVGSHFADIVRKYEQEARELGFSPECIQLNIVDDLKCLGIPVVINLIVSTSPDAPKRGNVPLQRRH